MTAWRAVHLLVLALLEGALVGLPKPNALPWLHRLRSPLGAAALPASIVIGTFAPLASPALALALVVVAAAAMLPLAAAGVLTVIDGSRLLAVSLAVAAAILGGISAITIFTVLACLAVGVGLARLIPGRWMLGAVLCMCGLDVAFLATGIGDTAGTLLGHAANHLGAGALTQAQVGHETLDYPDLVLAAALGAFLAGDGDQRRGAWLVAALCSAFFFLSPSGGEWPATVPLAVALVALRLVRGLRPRRSVLRPRASEARA